MLSMRYKDVCLPASLGGVTIENLSSFANEQFNASSSRQVTKPIVNLILSEDTTYPYETLAEQVDVN